MKPDEQGPSFNFWRALVFFATGYTCATLALVTGVPWGLHLIVGVVLGSLVGFAVLALLDARTG